MEMKSNIIRQINKVNIIKYLHEQKSATKTDISMATKLSFPTVGKILSELLKDGEIESQTFDISNGGRPAERFAINASNTMVLALYMDTYSFEYQVRDSLKNIVADKSVALREEDDAYSRLIAAIKAILTKYKAIKIISLGIPGSISNDIVQFMPQRYKIFNGKNLIQDLEERFEMPVLLENDINAIVQGQHTSDPMEYSGSLVYLYRGADGIGMGFTIDGKLIRGDNGLAGEVGFIPFDQTRTMFEAIEQAADENELAEVISKLVITSICFLNPSYFMMSGVKLQSGLIPMIDEITRKYCPVNVQLPKMLAIDDTRDLYFNCLVNTALEVWYS